MFISLQLDSTDRIIIALKLSYLLFLFSSIPNALGYTSRAHIFIYAGCSQEKYQPNTPFEANLNSFLSSVSDSSSENSYNSYAIGNGSSSLPEGSIYGLYQCRSDLRPKECSKCVKSCVDQIGLVCPLALGASLQFEGCYIRYEHVDFLGKPDTSLWYKKCSKAVTSDAEFLRRRDDVLSDLQAANGFGVSSSGFVEGFALCLGDLNVADCSSCLQAAVGKLRSICGSAASADVFLAQCYARYWEAGYYDQPESSNEDDQVGKSVAIIVGVLAGLAIIVVLLSICRRAFG
ncbi:cysteine-rich repeat secretory protein 15 [Vigna radiata var. radiata]|uniref:Cysteine-rich repeat secretory protein 15 n=1 Tax=Vigna radiata var. radiata TaxID=3916 RepID=A0A1S3VD28_VIGRR|nr:cysteine-rich repeat secretory protein 15 [Vigna radiata var. radiata]